MKITPFDKVTDIDTRNPYVGLTTISSGEKFLDIAAKFPRHQVFVKAKSSVFPTSIINDGAIHIHYNEGGRVAGLELMVFELADNRQSLIWKEMNILQGKMEGIANFCKSCGMSVENTGYGLDVPDLGLSFFSSDFDDLLQSGVDSVYIKLISVD